MRLRTFCDSQIVTTSFGWLPQTLLIFKLYVKTYHIRKCLMSHQVDIAVRIAHYIKLRSCFRLFKITSCVMLHSNEWRITSHHFHHKKYRIHSSSTYQQMAGYTSSFTNPNRSYLQTEIKHLSVLTYDLKKKGKQR